MYNYKEEREGLFTKKGQEMFLKVRDQVGRLFETAEVITMEAAIGGTLGSGWEQMACVDRLLELREIVEISGSGIPAQHRVFKRRT